MTAIRLDLDAAIMGAVNFQGFVKNMRERGYEVEKRGRDWRIKPQNHRSFSRLRRFGEKYTEDAIIERIIRQRWPSQSRKPGGKENCSSWAHTWRLSPVKGHMEWLAGALLFLSSKITGGVSATVKLYSVCVARGYSPS